RRALDAHREGASCIQTVAGRGYRFTPQVFEPVDPEPLPPVTATPKAAPVESASDAAIQLPEQPTPLSLQASGAPPVLMPDATDSAAKWAMFGVGAALVVLVVVAILSRSVSSDNQCQNGLVPRQAFQGDRVCVSHAAREQTIADNIAAPSRTMPNGLCIAGY